MSLLPFQQGQLDRLCGLYSIINALRLCAEADRPITGHESRLLFMAGVEWLAGKRKLKAAIQDGMSEATWIGLAHELTDIAGEIAGGVFEVAIASTPTDSADLPAFITKSSRKRRTLAMLLEGAYDHFTVISAVKVGKIELFDSFGYAWIRWNGFKRRQRHRVSEKGVLMFRYKSGPAGKRASKV